MQLNPFQNGGLMFQPKEILCCITSIHHSAFGLSTLLRVEGTHLYTFFARCIVFDRSVLWIHIVTPMFGYLLEKFQTQKPWEEGILPSIHTIPRGECVCVSPIAQLLERGGESVVLQLSCPPCRIKGRVSQVVWPPACWCDTYMEWPEVRCDCVTFFNYVNKVHGLSWRCLPFPAAYSCFR